MGVTIKDVANHAGVSIATVSYVVNKSKYVSPELTNRVKSSIAELGYQGNRLARSLRQKKSNVVGVILQNIRNIFFPQLFTGLEDCARKHNINLMFFNTYNDINLEKRAISDLNDMWVDGIILDSCVSEKDAKEYVDYLENYLSGRHMPIVLLERTLGSIHNNAVIVNNLAAGYEATKHLIEIGKRNIIHLGINQNWQFANERREGYLLAMQDFGLSSSSTSIQVNELYPQAGFEAMQNILAQKIKVDGIFTFNDQIALGAVNAIIDAGLKIPDDIAVVGFDNIFVTSMTNPSLTTINVPKYNMGKEAMNLLMHAIKSPDAQPVVKTLPSSLIVRQSTDRSADTKWDLFGW